MPFSTHTKSVQNGYKDFQVWNLHLQKKKYFQVIPPVSLKHNHVFEKLIINFSSSQEMHIERAIDCLSSPTKEFTFPFCICLRVKITLHCIFKAYKSSKQDKKFTK
jgi:hypothetical protein